MGPRTTAASWQDVTGSLASRTPTAVETCPDGTTLAVTAAGEAYRWSPGARDPWQQVGTGVSRVAVGAAGHVRAIGRRGRLLGAGATGFVPVGGWLRQVSVNRAGVAAGTTATVGAGCRNVFVQGAGGWHEVDGHLASCEVGTGVGGDPEVWGLTGDGAVLRRDLGRGTWLPVPGPGDGRVLTALSAGHATVWARDAAGGLCFADLPSDAPWVVVEAPGPVAAVSVGRWDAAWALGEDGRVYRLDAG